MKKNCILLALALATTLPAQKRYFDPVFPNVTVTADAIYGTNATVLLAGVIGQAIPQALKMDVYEPAGDTASARPLIILLHSGGFLPPQVNGGCNGHKTDGEVVELARRLAQRGFVIAAANYRVGWSPLAPAQADRIFTFLNAIQRGVQDSRTCVRFFRKDHATANDYRIDPSKITLWGIGTGGIVALASATIDAPTDWYSTNLVGSPLGIPYVAETVIGNPDATNVGIVPSPPPSTLYPVGDTLCYPNHIGYSSDFALAVHAAGVLMDTTWLQADDVPILSFANPSSPLEPCGIGCLGFSVPPVTPVFCNVVGSCALQARQAGLGNNEVWENAGFDDPLSTYALSVNGGEEGFFRFLGTSEYAPWAFATSPSPYGVANAMCDTDFASASAYLDTILAYFAPRACAVLDLDEECVAIPSASHEIWPNALKISPNPADGDVLVEAASPILALELYDLQGRLLWQKGALRESSERIPRGHLPPGLYVLRARFEQEIRSTKITWE